MTTLKVHLADAPTDVLIWLCQQPADLSTGLHTIARHAAPADADDPVGSTASALRLLIDCGYVTGERMLFRATPAGRRAVRSSAGVGVTTSGQAAKDGRSAGLVTARSWTFDLPYTKPLSLTDRDHRAQRARDIARIRRDTGWLTRAAKVPALQRISVELHYAPRDKRRRDPLNLVATLKPIEDGIIDAGVCPDDTPEYVQSPMPITLVRPLVHYVPAQQDTP